MSPSSPLIPASASAAPAQGVGGHVDDVAHASSSKLGLHKREKNMKAQTTRSKEPSLAHQAALHRSSKASSSHPQQPVLVHPAPSTSTSTASTAMRKQSTKSNRPISHSITPIPDPSAFTFASILDSLGPDGDAAIEAIAEICGKSNLSLAEEHQSHLPPHEEISGLGIARNEGRGEEATVEVGIQTRSMTRKRAERSGITSATTTVNASGQNRDGDAANNAGMLPQILAWLRGAGSRTEEDGAVRNLRGLLDQGGSMRL
ncbi:MAG: hypothetical protein Q9217_003405 [Psora testacea]